MTAINKNTGDNNNCQQTVKTLQYKNLQNGKHCELATKYLNAVDCMPTTISMDPFHHHQSRHHRCKCQCPMDCLCIHQHSLNQLCPRWRHYRTYVQL